jgi:hypothetical protein
MPIKAAVFFNSIVRPTVNEFLCDTGDLRRGFLAAIVLNPTADYWWLENKNNVQGPILTIKGLSLILYKKHEERYPSHIRQPQLPRH